MPSKATQVDRGINRNAGRGAGSMTVKGSGTTVKPIGRQQGDRDERSAGNAAARGNELVKQPAAGTKSYK